MNPEIAAAFAIVAHQERLDAGRHERGIRESLPARPAHDHRPARVARLVARVTALRANARHPLTPATATPE
jgi:hypothetical protein